MKKILPLLALAVLCTAAFAANPPDTSTTVPTGQKEVDISVTIANAADPSLVLPLSYQWKKDGVAIAPPKGTLEPLILVNLQVTDSGRYTVTVSNSAGSTDSLNGAVLAVTPPPVPPSGAVVQQPVVK